MIRVGVMRVKLRVWVGGEGEDEGTDQKPNMRSEEARRRGCMMAVMATSMMFASSGFSPPVRTPPPYTAVIHRYANWTTRRTMLGAGFR